MMEIKVLWVLVSVLSQTMGRINSSGSATEPRARGSEDKTPLTDPIKQRVYLSQAHMQFTLDLMATILIADGYNPQTRLLDSFAFSPLSIQSVLMMLQLGSRGSTRAEITNALYLSQLDTNATFTDAHEIYGQSVQNLLGDSAVSESLSMANQLFVQKDLIPTSTYELALRHYHATRLKPIDFAKDAVQTVNDWVSKHTKGMVTEFLVSPPSPFASLMAINALHFKGDWKYQFDPRDTETGARFHLTNGKTTPVAMMVGKMAIGYAYNDSLRSTIIELPYRVPRMGLFLLLPDDVKGLFSLLRSLNATTFSSLIASMRKTGADGVNVRLPKFDIESTPRLANILRNNLGIRSLFSNGEADLSGMFLYSPGPVHVDEFLHKAIFKINEKGTLAAAVSATIVERVGAFSGPYFEADHPFLYFLTDKQSGLIIFAGIYAGPQQVPKNSNI